MENIGIITAMAIEADEIRTHMATVKTVSCPFAAVWTGTIGSKSVTLMQSGAGKVCATMATQWLIDHVSPATIYNVGIAGSLIDAINTGSVIIGSRFVQHDVMPAPWLGRAQGEVPFVGELSYPAASPSLMDKIEHAANTTGSPFMRGTILSGDEPIFSEVRRAKLLRIFAHFNPAAVDMESAAFAFTAAQNNIPFAVIRTIADKAGSIDKPTAPGANAAKNGTATLAAEILRQVLVR